MVEERPRKKARFQFRHDAPSLRDIVEKKRELAELRDERKTAFNKAIPYIAVLMNPIWIRVGEISNELSHLEKQKEDALKEVSCPKRDMFVVKPRKPFLRFVHVGNSLDNV